MANESAPSFTKHQNKILRGLPDDERAVLEILIADGTSLTVSNIRRLVPAHLTIKQIKAAVQTLIKRELVKEVSTPGHVYYTITASVLSQPDDTPPTFGKVLKQLALPLEGPTS